MYENIDDPLDISPEEFRQRTQGKRVFLVTDPEIAENLRCDKAEFNDFSLQLMEYSKKSVDQWFKDFNARAAGKEPEPHVAIIKPQYCGINLSKLIGMKNLPFMVASEESPSLYNEMEQIERFCFAGHSIITVPRENGFDRQWYKQDGTVHTVKAIFSRQSLYKTLHDFTPPAWLVEVNAEALIKQCQPGGNTPAPG